MVRFVTSTGNPLPQREDGGEDADVVSGLGDGGSKWKDSAATWVHI